LPAADGQCEYYFGELPNPIAQDSGWDFSSGSLFQVHRSAFFSLCSAWRFFIDDGRSHEHNGDRIRFDHSTVRFRFDPTRQGPPATQSATENFTAFHMMP